jgi:beta-N-acetylhexosaminidase
MVINKPSVHQKAGFIATFLSRVFAITSVIVILFAQQAAAITQDDIDCANQGGLSGTCFFEQAACTPASTPANTDTTLSVPSDFTDSQKIAQLLVVGVTNPSTATTLEKKYQIGGFLLNDNGGSFDYSAADTGNIAKAGELPALFAVDEEGGEVDRLNTSVPSAKQMGHMTDAQVKQQGASVGKKMADLGITVDFAPVLDVDNGSNAAISVPDRSFSSDSDVVAQKAGAFAEGLRSAGITPTFKHFPGLGRATGSTNGNTDTGSATTPPLTSLEANDLQPYAKLLGGDTNSAVMVGNQTVPGLTNGDPASLSKPAYDLLQNKYGFSKVTFTDDLDAKAVGTTPADAVVKALEAGAVMPLFNPSSQYSSIDDQVTQTISAVQGAIAAGKLSQSTIDGDLSNVIALKNLSVQPASAGGASSTPASNLNYEAIGNIPFSGEDVGASTFGGSYVNNSWGPSNGVQGVQSPRTLDDNGQGNGSGSPAGHAAYAELDNGTALGSIPDHTKLAITYNGKTIVAEKLDVGGGGGPVNGKPREVDLWWEAAKLLDFTNGTDVINIRAVDPSTPATPVDGVATSASANPASETCSCPDSSTPGSPATLTGSTNAEQAFNYFVTTMSLPPEAAAGLVGNFQQESGDGLDTHDSNGTHTGIVQWSDPGRWTSLVSFENGKDPFALTTQLDYVMHELTTESPYKTNVLPALKTATSPKDAADTVYNNYEVATGDGSGPKREANAQNLMNQYGHNPSFGPSPTTACDTGASTPGGAGPNGWDLSGANAMTYFGQCDPKWGSHPYGNPGQTSICESGCGITSLAMVVDTLTGKNETPLTLGNKYGARYHTSGTSWSLWPVAANDFSLHMQDIGTDFNKASQIIKSGGLVIGSFDIGFFTTEGHFMVLRSVNSSGQFYLADPNNTGAKALGRGDTNNTPYSTSFLSNQGALSHMWAFTK